MVKGSDSPSSIMINRNWVLKRKRKKLLHGRVHCNGKEEKSAALESPRSVSASAAKRRPQNELSPELLSSKKKGNDGVSFHLFTLLLSGMLACMSWSAFVYAF